MFADLMKVISENAILVKLNIYVFFITITGSVDTSVSGILIPESINLLLVRVRQWYMRYINYWNVGFIRPFVYRAPEDF